MITKYTTVQKFVRAFLKEINFTQQVRVKMATKNKISKNQNLQNYLFYSIFDKCTLVSKKALIYFKQNQIGVTSFKKN